MSKINPKNSPFEAWRRRFKGNIWEQDGRIQNLQAAFNAGRRYEHRKQKCGGKP